MSKTKENEYVKRTQRDYSYSFKLQVIKEIESGQLGIKAAQRKYGIQGNATVTTWLRKYGSLDWENKASIKLTKSPEQKLLKLEAKVRLLEKQKSALEKQLSATDKKAIFFRYDDRHC